MPRRAGTQGTIATISLAFPQATEIGRRGRHDRQTVIAWRARHEAGGIDALADLVGLENSVVLSDLGSCPEPRPRWCFEIERVQSSGFIL
jgi:hypothetical protein